MAARLKKRADGRYCKQITIGIKNGKPVKKSFYGLTIKEVEKKVRDFESLRDKGIILSQDDITFLELSDMWMKNEKSYALKPQSYRNLGYQIKVINTYIGGIKIRDLKQSHIEEMKAVMLKAGRIDQYNKAVSSIRAILDYAISKEMLIRNVATGLKKVPRGPSNKRALTQHERHLAENAELDKFEKCFLNLLLYAGLRECEALALSVSDINFKEGYISVHKTLVASLPKDIFLQENTKTLAGVRKIPMPECLRVIMKDYCKDKVGILFESKRGGYLTSGPFRTRWKKILGKLKEANNGTLADDITPHIFRHTYASDLYKAGVDIKTAQYLLGHKDIKTTLNIYTHFGYKDVSIDSLEEYYKSVKNQSDDTLKQFKLA